MSKCEICNGAGVTLVPIVHKQSKIKTMASVPCVCLISRLVSQENGLIKYLGDSYLHPDLLDSRFVFFPEDLPNSPNFIVTGNSDNFKIQIKSLLMKNRFLMPKPRILFSRSIDIVQEFHVPQDNDLSPHLSSTLVFDLIIVIFGTFEKNKALAPCMAQMIMTRKEEKKPTWIYIPPPKVNVGQCEQEKSAELEEVLKDFQNLELSSQNSIAREQIKKVSKNNAADFNVGNK